MFKGCQEVVDRYGAVNTEDAVSFIMSQHDYRGLAVHIEPTKDLVVAILEPLHGPFDAKVLSFKGEVKGNDRSTG